MASSDLEICRMLNDEYSKVNYAKNSSKTEKDNKSSSKQIFGEDATPILLAKTVSAYTNMDLDLRRITNLTFMHMCMHSISNKMESIAEFLLSNISKEH